MEEREYRIEKLKEKTDGVRWSMNNRLLGMDNRQWLRDYRG